MCVCVCVCVCVDSYDRDNIDRKRWRVSRNIATILTVPMPCWPFVMGFLLKMKTMVIGRKPKKIYVQIKDESVEQVESFTYLG